MEKNDLRCPVCLATWHQASLARAGIKGCPHCRTSIEPVWIRHDGYVKVNWQDLRVLAIYAKRFSKMWDPTPLGNRDALIALEHIIRKLSNYQPADGAPLIPPNDGQMPPDAVIELLIQELEKTIHNDIKYPERPNFDMNFELKDGDLKPNEQGQIPSPFIKKKS